MNNVNLQRPNQITFSRLKSQERAKLDCNLSWKLVTATVTLPSEKMKAQMLENSKFVLVHNIKSKIYLLALHKKCIDDMQLNVNVQRFWSAILEGLSKTFLGSKIQVFISFWNFFLFGFVFVLKWNWIFSVFAELQCFYNQLLLIIAKISLRLFFCPQ